MGGWVGVSVGRGASGRMSGQRVISENNNSQDVGAYTFKAGPAPPAPAGPPAPPARPRRGVALVALGSVNLTRSPTGAAGRAQGRGRLAQ